MRLKSFYAKTMTEAMQMVRDTLGEDAIIVATREENGGKSVRVTAAVEQMPDRFPRDDRAGTTTAGDVPDAWLQFDAEEDDTINDQRVLDDVTDLLIRHSVPEDISDPILSCVSVIGIASAREALAHSLENLFNFIPLPARSYKKALLLVGPPGAGKTMAVSKIAARAVMDGRTVSLATADTVRAGGFEQLAALARVLGRPLDRVDTPESLKIWLSKNADADFRIVDTAGINPLDTADVKNLARLVLTADVEPVLVLPAGMDAADAGDYARIFAAIGVKRLIPSGLDLTRRLGSLLSAAHQGALSFADYTASPSAAEGLTPLSSGLLADILVNPLHRLPKDAAATTPHRSTTRKAG